MRVGVEGSCRCVVREVDEPPSRRDDVPDLLYSGVELQRSKQHEYKKPKLESRTQRTAEKNEPNATGKTNPCDPPRLLDARNKQRRSKKKQYPWVQEEPGGVVYI